MQLPCAFICHASESKPLARQIAGDFMKNGIDKFFDEWEIGPGDSIRQKIDAGLVSCTHFFVLLTPQSLPKPWVNAEIDAGFLRKLEGHCQGDRLPGAGAKVRRAQAIDATAPRSCL
jgi:hypothetical protein